MENATVPRLLTLSAVCERTGLSRSALYREFSNPRGIDGVVRENPKGRLKVTHIGRAIRFKEADLCAFIEALGK
jgi:predicted DNA-binding transcriptional regulator AlpA